MDAHCPRCGTENNIEFLDAEKIESEFMYKKYIKTIEHYTCLNCMKCFDFFHVEKVE
jgi:uncharacterized protein with PIN domain